jgi:hypothetical protein
LKGFLSNGEKVSFSAVDNQMFDKKVQQNNLEGKISVL